MRRLAARGNAVVGGDVGQFAGIEGRVEGGGGRGLAGAVMGEGRQPGGGTAGGRRPTPI
jgi:hypothetical protein